MSETGYYSIIIDRKPDNAGFVGHIPAFSEIDKIEAETAEELVALLKLKLADRVEQLEDSGLDLPIEKQVALRVELTEGDPKEIYYSIITRQENSEYNLIVPTFPELGTLVGDDRDALESKTIRILERHIKRLVEKEFPVPFEMNIKVKVSRKNDEKDS